MARDAAASRLRPDESSAILQTPARVRRRLEFGNRQFQDIERTCHSRWTFARHVRVDHGRFQTLVPEQNLNRPQIDAALDQVRRETVPQRRTPRPPIKPGASCRTRTA